MYAYDKMELDWQINNNSKSSINSFSNFQNDILLKFKPAQGNYLLIVKI